LYHVFSEKSTLAQKCHKIFEIWVGICCRLAAFQFNQCDQQQITPMHRIAAGAMLGEIDFPKFYQKPLDKEIVLIYNSHEI